MSLRPMPRSDEYFTVVFKPSATQDSTVQYSTIQYSASDTQHARTHTHRSLLVRGEGLDACKWVAQASLHARTIHEPLRALFGRHTLWAMKPTGGGAQQHVSFSLKKLTDVTLVKVFSLLPLHRRSVFLCAEGLARQHIEAVLLVTRVQVLTPSLCGSTPASRLHYFVLLAITVLSYL